MVADLRALTTREREVVLAAAEGAPIRVIAQRLVLSPRTVEHHLSAAYHKLGVTNRASLVALLRHPAEQFLPATAYALSGDAHIAYQVVGDGRSDVVLIPGFISNVETAWTWPAHADFLRRLSAGRRLIVFDKRGTGLSDPVDDPSRLTFEQRMDEVRAVMDAAGSRRATLFGFSEGAALSMLFAATYPSRTNGLILYGALISSRIGPKASGIADVFADPALAWEIIRKQWGTGGFLAAFGPSAAGVESEMAHVARFERHGASPAAAYAIIRMAGSIEVRGLCPAVHAPSLILHRSKDTLVPVANGRYLANHLPDARYVELEGADHPPWLGENQQLLDEVDRFLAVDHPAGTGGALRLQALLLADRPLKPALLSVLQQFGGRPASSVHGVVYTFSGVVRAVECGLALTTLDSSLRVAIHAGELHVNAAGIAGSALHVIAAVLAASPAGLVSITSVVKDLALGAALNLASGPMLVLPSGEQMTLFRAGRQADPNSVA